MGTGFVGHHGADVSGTLPAVMPAAVVDQVPPGLLPLSGLLSTAGGGAQAATQLARAAEDVGTTSAAVALATAAGNTQSLAEAAIRAVQQEGASAEALACALSVASGGSIDPVLLRSGDASAVAAAVDSNIRGGLLGRGAASAGSVSCGAASDARGTYSTQSISAADTVEVIVSTNAISINAASQVTATALAGLLCVAGAAPRRQPVQQCPRPQRPQPPRLQKRV